MRLVTTLCNIIPTYGQVQIGTYNTVPIPEIPINFWTVS